MGIFGGFLRNTPKGSPLGAYRVEWAQDGLKASGLMIPGGKDVFTYYGPSNAPEIITYKGRVLVGANNNDYQRGRPFGNRAQETNCRFETNAQADPGFNPDTMGYTFFICFAGSYGASNTGGGYVGFSWNSLGEIGTYCIYNGAYGVVNLNNPNVSFRGGVNTRATNQFGVMQNGTKGNVLVGYPENDYWRYQDANPAFDGNTNYGPKLCVFGVRFSPTPAAGTGVTIRQFWQNETGVCNFADVGGVGTARTQPAIATGAKLCFPVSDDNSYLEAMRAGGYKACAGLLGQTLTDAQITKLCGQIMAGVPLF